MLVYLIGYMGSGKSTYGKRLAEELGLAFIDTDDRISESKSLSIPQIFEQYGEAYFRKLESEVLKDISKLDHHIIATGGGLACNSEHLRIMHKTGLCIYLNANSETLYQRLSKEKEERPTISGLSDHALKTKITEQLKEREFYYSQAQINFNTEQSSFTELAQLIKKQFA